MIFLHCNKVLKLAMEAIGKEVAKRPYIFIALTSAVSIILGGGMVLSASKYVKPSPEFVSVKDGKYEKNKQALETLFPINVSTQFDPLRLYDPPPGLMLYIVNRNRGSSMLDNGTFHDIGLLDKIVRNVSILTGNGLMRYVHLCAKEHGDCFPNPIIKILPKIDEIQAGKFRFKFPIDVNERRFKVAPYVLNLGGVTLDKEKYVTDFKAVRLMYSLDTDINKEIYMKQWEKVVLEEIHKLSFENVAAYPIFYSNITDDFGQVVGQLLRWSPIIGVIILLFCIFVLTTNSWIKSKPWLGIAVVASAGLGIVSAYGTMFYAGAKNTDLTVFVAFVLMGIEIDDAFVLVASWRTTDPEKSVEQRMGETYSEAAVSVTVSSLTSFIAYCVGIAVPLMVAHDICIQCAVCILFTYVYQIFFFGSFMALDGYREKSERNSFFFCHKNSVTSTVNNDKEMKNEDVVMKFTRDVFGRILKHPVSKVVIVSLFVTNVTIASLGVINLQNGVDVTDVLKSGSRTERAFEIDEKYFSSYQLPIHIAINKTLNYWDKNVQESISNMLKNFENHPNIDPQITVSWLSLYKRLSEHPMAKSSIMSYNISNKENFLHGLRKFFLRIRLTQQFEKDINFNEDYTEITSSRFIVVSGNFTDVVDIINFVDDINAIAAKSDIPLILFSMLFIQGEHGLLIGKITIQTIWVTSLLILIVFLIFIGNLMHAVLVAVCVLSSMVGTVGFMALWGIKLNVMMLIVLIVCLGFSINYLAHMSYSFTTARGTVTHEKLKESMYRVGLPVIQGSVSTLLAIIILLFQDLNIYFSCFKIIFLTVMETAFHSLFVLPVFLCILDSCASRKSDSEKKSGISSKHSVYMIESHHL